MSFAVTRELLACYESLSSSSGAVESPEPEITGHLRRSDGCRISRDDGGAGFEGDGGAEPGELLLEVLVAPQDVVRAVHDRRALGHQSCHHEGRSSAQVRRLHDGPRESARTPDQGPVTAEKVYPCIEAVELLGHLEPVLVDVLRDDAGPRSLGEQHHHLGLEVGREAGERKGSDVDTREGGGILDPRPDAGGTWGCT